MKRIAFVGRKGGVGKTACTVTAADDLAHRRGMNVLVIDMDPQANATSWLGIDEPKRTMSDVLYHSTLDGALDGAITETEWDNVWCAPAEEELAAREADRAAGAEVRLRRVLRTSDIESWCDVVVIDSPPSLGPLFLNVLNASTDAVVVTDSEVGGVNGLAKLLDTATVVQEETHPGMHIAGLMMNRYNASTSEHPARWDELVTKYPGYQKWRGPGRVAVGTASGASRPPREYRTASPFVSTVRDIVDHVMEDHRG